ncbi:MAG TPA: sulfite exporter TauE/SafE family protein [bacterium]|nr:sulfite exporter TauE/SafE family protein [bacterium]
MTAAQLAALAIFLLFSTLFGMFGIGGGAIYTPVQLYLGTPFNEAATVSLFLIAVTSISCGVVYVRAHLIDTPSVAALAVFSFTGSLCGGWSAGRVPEEVLAGLFAFFLLVNGAHLAFSDIREGHCEVSSLPRRLLWERTIAGERVVINLPLALPIAFLSGIFGGMVGLGGGIVMLPLMVTILRFPIKVAIATSSFLALATGIGGLLTHLTHTTAPWGFMIPAAFMVAIGSGIGARWTVQSHSKRIRRLLGVFFVAIAVLLFVRGY